MLHARSLRWRGTISARSPGLPMVYHDDWSLSTEDGETYARVFRSRTNSDLYFAAICLGRASVTSDITFGRLPSRALAMEACEQRLTLLAHILR